MRTVFEVALYIKLSLKLNKTKVVTIQSIKENGYNGENQ